MIDFSAWDNASSFRVQNAACLWALVDPHSPWRVTAAGSRVLAFLDDLTAAIEAGILPANGGVPGLRDFALVTRRDLITYALSKNQRPAFLFPDERTGPPAAPVANHTPARGGATAKHSRRPCVTPIPATIRLVLNWYDRQTEQCGGVPPSRDAFLAYTTGDEIKWSRRAADRILKERIPPEKRQQSGTPGRTVTTAK